MTYLSIKAVQSQELTASTISLEDALLRVLFAQQREVAGRVLAEWLGISENAVASIVNRIRMSHPHFIMITKEDEHGNPVFYLNKAVEREVGLFLTAGGFTALNEKERKEYERALIREIKQGKLGKRSIKEYRLKKALAGVTVIIGVITLFMKLSKESKR